MLLKQVSVSETADNVLEIVTATETVKQSMFLKQSMLHSLLSSSFIRSHRFKHIRQKLYLTAKSLSSLPSFFSVISHIFSYFLIIFFSYFLIFFFFVLSLPTPGWARQRWDPEDDRGHQGRPEGGWGGGRQWLGERVGRRWWEVCSAIKQHAIMMLLIIDVIGNADDGSLFCNKATWISLKVNVTENAGDKMFVGQ